ncbi:hypothetical protein OYT88_04725 [Sporolactobacillus sp. CQH2019]|uniref:hypothetical protein n=1 Tax=Sporolactobacillus sp. CQH2019 TaxID=3023512 RepID=UPI002367F577|nr:hypothetical protein [Sporolactobacillus sp. CQH2019]MDD9147853.1 hypothetical protein [Sporolactobacillus sp. CQH2019]
MIENAMVSGRAPYNDHKVLHCVVGECDSCGQSIYQFEEYFEMENGELVHDDLECKERYFYKHGIRHD